MTTEPYIETVKLKEYTGDTPLLTLRQCGRCGVQVVTEVFNYRKYAGGEWLDMNALGELVGGWTRVRIGGRSFDACPACYAIIAEAAEP